MLELEEAERRRRGDRVGVRACGEGQREVVAAQRPEAARAAVGQVVMRHRERRQQERASEQRRVEDVVAQPAEQQLAEADRERAAESGIQSGIPAGSVRPSRMPVIAAEPSASVPRLPTKPLRRDRARHRREHDEQRAHAEEPRRRGDERDERRRRRST